MGFIYLMAAGSPDRGSGRTFQSWHLRHLTSIERNIPAALLEKEMRSTACVKCRGFGQRSRHLDNGDGCLWRLLRPQGWQGLHRLTYCNVLKEALSFVHTPIVATIIKIIRCNWQNFIYNKWKTRSILFSQMETSAKSISDTGPFSMLFWAFAQTGCA